MEDNRTAESVANNSVMEPQMRKSRALTRPPGKPASRQRHSAGPIRSSFGQLCSETAPEIIPSRPKSSTISRVASIKSADESKHWKQDIIAKRKHDTKRVSSSPKKRRFTLNYDCFGNWRWSPAPDPDISGAGIGNANQTEQKSPMSGSKLAGIQIHSPHQSKPQNKIPKPLENQQRQVSLSSIPPQRTTSNVRNSIRDESAAKPKETAVQKLENPVFRNRFSPNPNRKQSLGKLLAYQPDFMKETKPEPEYHLFCLGSNTQNPTWRYVNVKENPPIFQAGTMSVIFPQTCSNGMNRNANINPANGQHKNVDPKPASIFQQWNSIPELPKYFRNESTEAMSEQPIFQSKQQSQIGQNNTVSWACRWNWPSATDDNVPSSMSHYIGPGGSTQTKRGSSGLARNSVENQFDESSSSDGDSYYDCTSSLDSDDDRRKYVKGEGGAAVTASVNVKMDSKKDANTNTDTILADEVQEIPNIVQSAASSSTSVLENSQYHENPENVAEPSEEELEELQNDLNFFGITPSLGTVLDDRVVDALTELIFDDPQEQLYDLFDFGMYDI